MGVRSSSIALFKLYLSARKQFITLGKVKPEQLSVKQGVPQGLILGPVLFLLFVNDMPLHVHKSTVDIYADAWFHLIFKFKLENYFITKPNIIWS